MLAENCDPWKYFQKKRIAHVVYVHPYRVGLSIVTKSVCCEVMRWWVGGVRGGCDSLLVFGKGQHHCHYPETHSTGGGRRELPKQQSCRQNYITIWNLSCDLFKMCFVCFVVWESLDGYSSYSHCYTHGHDLVPVMVTRYTNGSCRAVLLSCQMSKVEKCLVAQSISERWRVQWSVSNAGECWSEWLLAEWSRVSKRT